MQTKKYKGTALQREPKVGENFPRKISEPENEGTNIARLDFLGGSATRLRRHTSVTGTTTYIGFPHLRFETARPPDAPLTQ